MLRPKISRRERGAGTRKTQWKPKSKAPPKKQAAAATSKTNSNADSGEKSARGDLHLSSQRQCWLRSTLVAQARSPMPRRQDAGLTLWQAGAQQAAPLPRQNHRHEQRLPGSMKLNPPLQGQNQSQNQSQRRSQKQQSRRDAGATKSKPL